MKNLMHTNISEAHEHILDRVVLHIAGDDMRHPQVTLEVARGLQPQPVVANGGGDGEIV